MRGRFVSTRSMSFAVGVAICCALALEARGLDTWAQRLAVGDARDAALRVTGSLLALSERLGLDLPRTWLLEKRAQGSDLLFPESLQAAEVDRDGPDMMPGAGEKARAPTSDLERASDARVAPMQAAADQAHTAQATQGDAVVDPGTTPATAALTRRSAGWTIALVGDSMMAVGLGPVLQRRIRTLDGTSVLRAYRSATGLIRPDVFDWLTQYPRLIGDIRPDLVICVIGANDAQNVQVGKDVLRFNTPAWNEHYAARVRSFAELLSHGGTPVLWVNMPVMREAGFSRRMMTLNTVIRSTLSDIPGTEWLDVRPLLSDPDGGFLQYRKGENNRTVRLRADDGIHLSEEGAEAIAPIIMDWIRARIR